MITAFIVKFKLTAIKTATEFISFYKSIKNDFDLNVFKSNSAFILLLKLTVILREIICNIKGYFYSNKMAN